MDSNRLPENTVQYYLYPQDVPSNDVAEYLESLILECYSILGKCLGKYTWQDEPFHLKSVINQKDHYLYGRTHFQDNIEDEWFIVYLLFQLSLAKKDLIIKVSDDDGEFLLIEAADCLYNWAQKPSNTQGRVFIYHGEIHIIPQRMISSETSLEDFFHFIKTRTNETRCEDNVQKCIQDRIFGYPGLISLQRHRAHCSLPASIVWLLETNPKILSHAVRAFCHRTSDDIRAIKSSKPFPTKKAGSIVACVEFTRCLYAQLNAQPYGPKETGRNVMSPSKTAKENNIVLNGLKLTAGFQILVAHYLKYKSRAKEFQVNETRFNSFKMKLVDSDLSDETLRLVFEEIQRREDNTFAAEDYGKVTHEFMQKIDDKMLEEKIFPPLEPADLEGWLNIDEHELEAMLSEKFGCMNSNENMPEETCEQLKTYLESFIKEKSDYEGVEMSNNNQQATTSSNRINVDGEQFNNFLNNLKKPSVFDEDMDEYTDEESESDSDSDDFEVDEEVEEYFDAMQNELSNTIIGNIFKHSNEVDSDDDEDGDGTAAADSNVLSNILESYSAEKETSNICGPTTTIFASMGVKLPEKDIEESKKK